MGVVSMSRAVFVLVGDVCEKATVPPIHIYTCPCRLEVQDGLLGPVSASSAFSIIIGHGCPQEEMLALAPSLL
jgi:hypothetical protein